MKNTGLVFRFTFSRVLKNRTWQITTGVIALILLAVPALILTLLLSDTAADESAVSPVSAVTAEAPVSAESPASAEPSVSAEPPVSAESSDSAESPVSADNWEIPDAIYTADISTGVSYDFMDIGNRLDMQIISFDTAEEAISAAKEASAPAVLLTDYDDSYAFQILMDSDADNADVLENILTEALSDAENSLLLDKAGISPEEYREWEAQQHTDSEMPEDPMSILRMILVFLNVMPLYFLVLFYGKNTAESIVLEKSSKLIDTLLTSVRPTDLLYGKVFGVTASSILQLCIWLLCAGVSIAFGLKNSGGLPGEILTVLETVKLVFMSMPGSGIFPLVLAVLFLFAGFFLYSCLAALGGAAAGKQEDLASANTLFTLILVASYLLVLRWGIMPDNTIISTLLCWVPFTSIMLVPASLILGEMSMISGIASLCLTMIASLLIIYLASKIYRAFILYRGKMPGPQAIIRALKKK